MELLAARSAGQCGLGRGGRRGERALRSAAQDQEDSWAILVLRPPGSLLVSVLCALCFLSASDRGSLSLSAAFNSLL